MSSLTFPLARLSHTIAIPLIIVLALTRPSHQFLHKPTKYLRSIQSFPSSHSRSSATLPRNNDHLLSATPESNTEPTTPPSVLCIGETLYDSLPSGIYLGGAPTNVAIHLAALGTPTAIASCIGADELGDGTVQTLQTRGIHTSHIQRHAHLKTGVVLATIDEKTGDASYTFDTPSAWDCLELPDDLKKAASNTNVLVIGTIACRLRGEDGAASALTISKIRDLAMEDSVILDVNLRSPWYERSDVLELTRGGAGCHPLALIKVNDEELAIMEEWCGIAAPAPLVMEGEGLKNRMSALGDAVNANRVCVTRGEDGAALWCRSGEKDNREVFTENKGFAREAAELQRHSSGERDTVGAGDSFLAALVRSLFLEQESGDVALSRGCALGAYVANCKGAVPAHEDAPMELRSIFQF